MTQQPAYGTCPDCNIPLECEDYEYVCPLCQLVCINHGEEHKVGYGMAQSTIRLSYGPSKGRYLHNAPNGPKLQKKEIIKTLLAFQNEYVGEFKIPEHMFGAVATHYINLQRAFADRKSTSEDMVRFIRRGMIKNEILAAILYHECQRENLAARSSTIAQIMRLPTDGFSRGETVLRTLKNDGIIDLLAPLRNINDPYPIAERILTRLKILDETPANIDFVIRMYNRSISERIAMRSMLYSKITGIVWYMGQLRPAPLQFSPAALESAANNIKKNTFMQSYSALETYAVIFEDIISDYKEAMASLSIMDNKKT